MRNAYEVKCEPILCSKCKGKGLCGMPCPILARLKAIHKTLSDEVYGNSPPEIFVGRIGYPYVYSGILSPNEIGETSIYSRPELWFKNNAGITDIIEYRTKLVYCRAKVNVKNSYWNRRIIESIQEISASYKPVAVEIKLKHKPKVKFNFDAVMPLTTNPAELQKLRIDENPKIKPKVEKLINDDVKASEAVIQLYNAKIEISSIYQVLSAGLLGVKLQRRLVPTRWSITATDDIISKFLLNKIKYYDTIDKFMVFHSDYLGNHYEFILLPSVFRFEVLEAKMPGSVWNPGKELFIMQDYEDVFGRKTYAENVTGAYYANRLAVAEYLTRIRRQAACLVLREVRPEYFAPCGVGILREASRDAFTRKPEVFETLEEALKTVASRLKLNINVFIKKSWLLKQIKQQKTLFEFVNKNH